MPSQEYAISPHHLVLLKGFKLASKEPSVIYLITFLSLRVSLHYYVIKKAKERSEPKVVPEPKPQMVTTNGNKEHPISNNNGPSPRNFVPPTTTMNSPTNIAPAAAASAAKVAPESIAPMRAPVTNAPPMVNVASRATPTVASYNAPPHEIPPPMNIVNRDKSNNNKDTATRPYLPPNPSATKGMAYCTTSSPQYRNTVE